MIREHRGELSAKALDDYRFESPSGVVVERRTTPLSYARGVDDVLTRLDSERGVLLSSGIDYPDRYTRWDIAFAGPPLELVAQGRTVRVEALNPRGAVLLDVIEPILRAAAPDGRYVREPRRAFLTFPRGDEVFPEEERSLQPSAFTPLRALVNAFAGIGDEFLGLYGAFGYDLIFQFEQIDLRHARRPNAKDLHLFFPDAISVVDRQKGIAYRHEYVFRRGELTTAGTATEAFAPVPPVAAPAEQRPYTISSNWTAEEYADLVDRARARMAVGDVYELVLHRRFAAEGAFRPSEVYRHFAAVNPSPYQFLFQFGDEQLAGASPEMFIRVSGDTIESCPISGTVRRGENAMEDAERIRELYNSEKDEVELTMCTDVDRNDKARICAPGTVRLLGRRMIERYAGLFHTVDHVEGRLRPGLSGIDGFLSHMWAVTLTGTPKKMAVQLVEDMEREPRDWYGGAVGALMLNGDVTTGITIRTVHLTPAAASYRVGATLVYDSVGRDEDLETRTKATAFFGLIETLNAGRPPAGAAAPRRERAAEARPATGKRIVLVDNEDSFVHILADYFRQTGAEVVTYRYAIAWNAIAAARPHLVVHSPGPGRPERFGLPDLVRRLAKEGIPQFGVCLGLQGIVEAFGGRLGLLEVPRQGKRWTLRHDGTGVFAGVPSPCRVGAYHALYAERSSLPGDLLVTGENENGVVMAVRHRELPIAAVQFHPESILSLEGGVGHRMIANVAASI